MVNQKQPPYSRDNRASANEHGLRLGSLDMPLGMGPTRDKDTSAVAGRAMRLMLLAGWLAGWLATTTGSLSLYLVSTGRNVAFTPPLLLSARMPLRCSPSFLQQASLQLLPHLQLNSTHFFFPPRSPACSSLVVPVICPALGYPVQRSFSCGDLLGTGHDWHTRHHGDLPGDTEGGAQKDTDTADDPDQ